jgi:hypothetical protein
MPVSFTQEIEDLVSTTLPSYMPTVIDNVFKSIPLTIRLIERDNITIDGGTEIRQPFIFDETPSGWYSGEDSLNVSAKQTQTAMRFDWKFAYASVNLPMSELLLNAGASAITSLVTSKMQTAEITLRQRIATSLFSDGNAHNGKELIGLRKAVDDTGSYGGIDRASAEGAVLKSYVDSTGGNISLDLMQKAFGKATIEPERPDLIITTQRQYDKVWALVQSQQRFTPNQVGGLLGAAGFSAIDFNGAQVVVDQKCPPGEMYFLNTKYMKFVFHPQRRFEVEGPFPVANQDVKIWRVHVACAFIVQAPRLCAKITGLTE